MQKEFNDNLTKLYECVNQPMKEIAQLNAHVLTNWAKNTAAIEELTQAKKPEDFLWAQMKLANANHMEAITYVKKIGDIWAQAIQQANEICGEMCRETSEKTSDMMHYSTKKKQKA